MSLRTIIIITVVIIVISVSLYVYGRKKKKKEVSEIRERIHQDVGATGETNVKTLIYNVDPDPAFDATPVAKKIENAKGEGFFSNDDEDAVNNAFDGLTKAQVAAVDQEFRRRFDTGLDKFLKSFLSDSEYKTALSGVR